MLRRHRKFLWALAIGLVAGAVLPSGGLAQRALVAVDLFSAAYLALIANLVSRITVEDLRRHASEDDEGVMAILVVGIAVVALSLGLVFGALRSDTMHMSDAVLAGAGIPLAWAMLQTLFAFHYATLHYGRAGKKGLDVSGGQAATGGIRFEGTPDPGVWDFLYFSFTIGMTAQVSDSITLTPRVRRMVLGHAVLSFFYNTIILALAVNVGASMVG
jgi:uncharacterized membrane protein